MASLTCQFGTQPLPPNSHALWVQAISFLRRTLGFQRRESCGQGGPHADLQQHKSKGKGSDQEVVWGKIPASTPRTADPPRCGDWSTFTAPGRRPAAGDSEEEAQFTGPPHAAQKEAMSTEPVPWTRHLLVQFLPGQCVRETRLSCLSSNRQIGEAGRLTLYDYLCIKAGLPVGLLTSEAETL